MASLKGISERSSTAAELVSFFWKRKWWWMTPLVVLLLILGILIALGQGSPLAPLVYSLF